MKFLKFANHAAFELAFAPYMVDDGEGALVVPSYIDGVAVDVVGVINVESGETRDADIGEGVIIQVPVMVPVEGYHVNLSGPLPQFATYEVPAPATPYRVFAGWNAEPEPERVPTQVPRWAAVLALKSHNSELLENSTLWDAVVLVRNEIINKPDGEEVTMGGVTVPVTVDLKNRVVAALDDAMFWERDSEMVGLVALSIGLTPAKIDELFIWAGKQQM